MSDMLWLTHVLCAALFRSRDSGPGQPAGLFPGCIVRLTTSTSLHKLRRVCLYSSNQLIIACFMACDCMPTRGSHVQVLEATTEGGERMLYVEVQYIPSFNVSSAFCWVSWRKADVSFCPFDVYSPPLCCLSCSGLANFCLGHVTVQSFHLNMLLMQFCLWSHCCSSMYGSLVVFDLRDEWPCSAKRDLQRNAESL